MMPHCKEHILLLFKFNKWLLWLLILMHGARINNAEWECMQSRIITFTIYFLQILSVLHYILKPGIILKILYLPTVTEYDKFR